MQAHRIQKEAFTELNKLVKNSKQNYSTIKSTYEKAL